MASSAILKRLEARAVSAEQTIIFLKKEIADIKQFCSSSASGSNKEVRQLEQENQKLAQDIETCKQKLIKLEIANGKKQVPLPTAGITPVSMPKVILKTDTLVTSKIESSGQGIASLDAEPSAKAKKQKKPQQPKQPERAEDDVRRLDMKVGLIMKAERHPDADSLYVETIDVGNETPLTVVSGLAGKVPLEEMQNRLVILLCNLKPAKMRGIVSQAMVMCASEPGGKVEVLIPPKGSAPGDRVTLQGEDPSQPDAQLKSKVWEAVAAKLRTTNDLLAGFDGKILTVHNKGPIKTNSLCGVPIK